LAAGLRYVEYRVKDIEEVVFSGQSHGLGQRCPDNQFLFIGQIGLIFQQVVDYMVDMDSDSMRTVGFSLCSLFVCRSVKKCKPLMWHSGKESYLCLAAARHLPPFDSVT